MSYEIVLLSEKRIVGISTRVKEMTNEGSDAISALLKEIVSTRELLHDLEFDPRARPSYYRVSHGYSKRDSSYDVTVGYEASQELETVHLWDETIIPSGNYARFELGSISSDAIGMLWSEIYSDEALQEKRSFETDFRVYDPSNVSKVQLLLSLS